MSGLAAAVSLALHGIPSLILEQKPVPGGRASSFRDATTGKVLDNGQHVLIAGYRQTIRFLETIGASHLLSLQQRPSLLFHHPERGTCRFSVPRLQSPVHMIGAIATSDLLGIGDRWNLLQAGKALYQEDPGGTASLTINEWLDRHGQSDEARKSFWNPLSVSIMNELPGRAAALPFLRSLRETFLASWKNACIAIPRVGLSALYAEPACGFVQNHGGTILPGADVREILFDGSLAAGVRLRDGREFRGRAVILTVPPYRLPGLVPAECGIDAEAFRQFGYSPIVSTHLWFPHDFLSHDFMGLIGTQTQWVFNRTRIEETREQGVHISTVISAGYDAVERSNEEIIEMTLDDLTSVFGQIARPSHAVVIREKRATFSLTPEAEALRPPQKTAIRNLFLAGDWTHTGYPATIESAVISGNRCAELLRCIPAH